MKNLLLVLALFLVLPLVAQADPCLVVYPTGPVAYHYDPSEYYTVSYGDPLYQAEYERGGLVLLETSGEIPYDIYQAPGLTGFVPSTGGQDGYFFVGYALDLVLDGWSPEPVTYTNILLVFEPDPAGCPPVITVEGVTVTGLVYPIGSLVVSTPIGKHYSDTLVKKVTWRGCFGIRIWAFSDENGNGLMDGGECFTAFSHDLTIPVQSSSWGSIKSLYR